MNKLLLVAAALLMQPWIAQATPHINIGGLNDFLEASQATQVKRIYNSGTSTAFVKVSVWELVRGADGKYHEVAMDGQDSAQRSLVVSPARLIIPAGGVQSVRLLFRGDRNHERYYRLRFNPVMPETGDDFAVSDSGVKDYKESLSVGVHVLAGYGSLLYVRPKDPRFEVNVQERQGRIEVRNTGGSTVKLDRFKVCEGKGVGCKTPVVHYLLPGAVQLFEKPPQRSYSFDLVAGAESKSYAF
ncbi:pilus assembly protein [Pseudomonas vranovensis]|uniref:pilus assembly protein n=1 Tax=Pseudomonas vranovensis TaxID=321661 RepID=UPI00048B8854|nr:pilus assembly protein [Pseudomonas vranovensis]